MNGVEILSATQVVSKSVFNWTALWIAAGVILVFGVFVGFLIMLIEHDYFGLMAGILGGLFLSIMISPFIGALCSTPVEYETHCKVTIDDTVSMSEFMDKYEILDQEGKIYTVRERGVK